MALGYAADIRPLFRDTDIACMTPKGVRLGDSAWMCNAQHAQRVYAQLAGGTMPPDGAWPGDNVAKFKSWMDEGCNP